MMRSKSIIYEFNHDYWALPFLRCRDPTALGLKSFVVQRTVPAFCPSPVTAVCETQAAALLRVDSLSVSSYKYWMAEPKLES